MARSSGTWSSLFRLTLTLYMGYMGGWGGFMLASTHNQSPIWPMVFTVAGATLLGLLSVPLYYLAATVLMDREYQRRVVTLAIWGTTAVFLSVAMFLEFRSAGTVYVFSGMAILVGLIFGAGIGAMLLEGHVEVKDCPCP